MASLFDLLHGLTKVEVTGPDGNPAFYNPPETDSGKAPGKNALAFLQGAAKQEQAGVEPSTSVPSNVQIGTQPTLDAQGNPGEDAPDTGSSEVMQNEHPLSFMRPSLKQASTDSLGLPTANSPALTTKGKTLIALLRGGIGALEGSKENNAGAGFQDAIEQPIQMAGQRAQLASTHAATEREQAQTNLIKNTTTVRDPYGNSYQIPQAQLPAFLRSSITEQGKNNRNTENVNSRETVAGGKNAVSLRSKGLRPDGTPLPYEELTPAEQGSIDLKQSQEDAATAQAELNRAKNDPNSAAFKAAYGRLQVARQNAATAAGKLGLDVNKFNADYFGNAPGGGKLPGFSADENSGLPVSPKAASSQKMSADRGRRGDLAANGIQNIDNISAIVAQRPDLFGKVLGRVTNLKQLTGSNDPDIAALGVALHNLALASNGAHGVRSAQAIAQTENELLNHFHNGPDAVNSALGEMKGSLRTFVNAQKLGNRPQPSTSNGTPIQPQAAQPSPQTHVFDAKAWKSANPQGDVNAAISAAKQRGYQVLQ